MAGWVFKLKGLGVDPTIVRTYTLNDAASTRALDKQRAFKSGATPEDPLVPETNEEVLVRLWNNFMTDFVVNPEYLVRKIAAEVTATSSITKAVPAVTNTDV